MGDLQREVAAFPRPRRLAAAGPLTRHASRAVKSYLSPPTAPGGGHSGGREATGAGHEGGTDRGSGSRGWRGARRPELRLSYPLRIARAAQSDRGSRGEGHGL